MYALIQNGAVVRYPYSVTDAKFANPNVSFPPNPNDESLAEFGVLSVFFTPPPVVDPITYKVVEDTPIFNVDHWEQVWQTVLFTPEELAANQAQQEQSVRATRNAKLAESDWTQLADAPADKVSWAAYRQELRDVTSQAGFPWDVQWPVAPT